MNWLRAFKSTETAAVAKCIPSSFESIVKSPVVPKKKPPLHSLNSVSCGTVLRPISVSCGIGAPMQIRLVHTDVTNVPDFSSYRPNSTKSATVRSSDSEFKRKVLGYTVMFSGAVVATTASKYALKTFVMPLGPTAKTIAESSIEVSLSPIAEGKNLIVKWRNKPLFIRHRTEEEIRRERAVPLSELRDPETDESRVQRDEWLICLGVCSHLGCAPIANAGDFPGGFYCPCHGSHFDASGRIRRGPAPTNMEIPEYRFLDDDTVLIG